MVKSVCLYVVFLLTFLLYLPAAGGPYLFDDYPNLINNDKLILDSIDPQALAEAVTSSHTGFIGRPVSMLSFALNYTLTGNKDVWLVKLVNILLHLLVGGGLYLLFRKLLEQWIPGRDNDIFWTAWLASALWLIHPLQVSTVLYAVQRMTILSALFTVAGLLAYVKYRQATLQTNSGYLAVFVLLPMMTILGVLAKENAILLPLFALLVETVCFRFAFHPDSMKLQKTLLMALLFVPLVIVTGYLLFSYFRHSGTGIIWPYTFTIDQRLLTEPRILLHYLGWILLVNPEPMSLHHTDITVSTGLLTPATTLLSIGALALLVLAAGFSLVRRRFMVFGFGVLWFLTGHLIESTTIPLELIHEHRNYLPMAGILLVPAFFLVHTLGTVNPENNRVRIGVCSALLLLAGFLDHERIAVWRNEKSLIIDQLNKQPDIAWSWSDAASYLNRAGQPGHAIELMRTAAGLEPSEPAFIFGEAYIRCQNAPNTVFPDDFSTLLVSAFTDRPLTTTSIGAFVNMINACLPTLTNDATLRLLYGAAAANPQEGIADIGRRALDKLNEKDKGSALSVQP